MDSNKATLQTIINSVQSFYHNQAFRQTMKTRQCKAYQQCVKSMKEVPLMNEKLVDVEEEEFQQTSLKIRALEKFYSASDSLSQYKNKCLLEIICEKNLIDQLQFKQPKESILEERQSEYSRKELGSDFQLQAMEEFRRKKTDIINLQIENQKLKMKEKFVSDKVRNQRLMIYHLNKFDQNEKLRVMQTNKQRKLLEEQLQLVTKTMQVQKMLKKLCMSA